MTSINLVAEDAMAAYIALKEDVRDPVQAMRDAGQDVATFFEYGTWEGVDFRESDLEDVSFKGADLRGALFTQKQIAQVSKSEPKHLPSLPSESEQNFASEIGSDEFDSFATQPHSIEAEQQLLGAILTNNDVYDRVAGIVGSEHFFDPVHARIFKVAAGRIAKNQLASPVTLKALMEGDEGLAELGGSDYLTRLAGAAVSSFAVRDYATMLHDLASRRNLIALADEIKQKAENASIEGDIADQIVEAEQALYRLSKQGRSDGGYSSFLQSVTNAVNVANAAYQNDSGLYGLSTGIPALDRLLGGFHRSDLYLLASRPSIGKSSLAIDIANFCTVNYERDTLVDGTQGTVNGGVVAFCSPETSSEQIANRVLAIRSAVSMRSIAGGDMTEAQFRSYVDAAKSLEALPLYIDDTPLISLSEVAARARRLKRTHGLDLLIVDTIQQIRPTKDAERLDSEDRSQVAQGLKALARELDIPVLALSDLSSDVDDREKQKPKLSDLREFGLLERYADVVLFLTRDGYYSQIEMKLDANAPESQEHLGRAQIVVAKNRRGPTGSIEVAFDYDFATFWSSFASTKGDKFGSRVRSRSEYTQSKASDEDTSKRSSQRFGSSGGASDDEIPF